MHKYLAAVALLLSSNAHAMSCWQVIAWTPIQNANNETATLSQVNCQGGGTYYKWLAAVDHYGIMPDDIWLKIHPLDAHIVGNQFYSIPAYAGDNLGVPIIELELILDGSDNLFPLFDDAPDPCAPNVAWWDGSTKYTTFDDYNCQVAQVPPGETGFVWANQYYITPDETQRWCPLGVDDGANCRIDPLPAGSTPYVSGTSLFVTEQNGGGCGIGFPFVGACYIGEIGHHANAFVWAGALYVTSLPTCHYGNYDGANCHMGTPAAGVTAFIWPNSSGSFYYSP